MGKQAFTAMLALAAFPVLAVGQGGYNPTPQSPLSALVPASQAVSPPSSPVRVESAPPSANVLDSRSEADPGVPCDNGGGLSDGGHARQFWIRGEYLLWRIKDGQVPPLITTGIAGTSPLPGALGQSGTTVLFGGSDMDNSVRSGARFSGGLWLDNCQTIGLEASYFFLGSRSVRFDMSADGSLGSSLIGRPFFDVLAGSQNSQLVAFPLLAGGTNALTASGTGLASGDIHASSYSRLQGGDINAFCNLCSGCNYRVQMLGGFRYLQLNEGIGIIETSHINPALPANSPFFGGSTISIADQFDTRNNFYGGQVGLRGEVRSGRMFVELQAKVALGATHEVVDIHGSTAITSAAGTTVLTPAGFLATGSNSGTFTSNRFAVVPEVGINLGCQITSHLRALVGYTFMYCSSVVRPGDQIDTGLSGTQIPTDSRYNPQAGPIRPAVPLRQTDFWAQGINLGLELRF
jgi:hypothetical protein